MILNSELSQTTDSNNQSLERWSKALESVQQANQQAVWGETLASRSELLTVLEDIDNLVAETRGHLSAVGLV